MSLLLIGTLIGCGSVTTSDYQNAAAYAPEAAYGSATVAEEAYDTEMTYSSSSSEEINPIEAQEKLVYSGSLSIETLNYSEAVKSIREQVKSYQGVIEYETERDNEYNWYYTDHEKTRGTKVLEMTVRIPTASFQDFLSAMEGTGKVLSRSTNVENITQAYYSTKTEIESLEIQQKRLLEMLETAESIEDMLAIEARLSEVETSLKLHQNNLNRMNTDVEYSTVHLSVSEVMTYTPEETGLVTGHFFDRVQRTINWAITFFVYLLQQIVLWLIRLIPVALIVGCIIAFVKWLKKKGVFKSGWHILPRKKEPTAKEGK